MWRELKPNGNHNYVNVCFNSASAKVTSFFYTSPNIKVKKPKTLIKPEVETQMIVYWLMLLVLNYINIRIKHHNAKGKHFLHSIHSLACHILYPCPH